MGGNGLGLTFFVLSVNFIIEYIFCKCTCVKFIYVCVNVGQEMCKCNVKINISIYEAR